MSRALTAFEPLHGEPRGLEERFLAPAGDWLPAPARPAGPDAWVITIGVSRLQRRVTVAVGDPWRVEHAIWRALIWTPMSEQDDLVPLEGRLPGFAGEIGLHVPEDGPPGLMLDGRYTPPGGLAGQVADRVLLHRVATRTARRLLTEIAARLGPSGGAWGTAAASGGG